MQKHLFEIFDESEAEDPEVVPDDPKPDAPKAKNGWGGRRAGSGQKKIIGAKRCTFMLTEEQAGKVKAFVKQLRSGKLD